MSHGVRCPACGAISTLIYRCSECGFDFANRDDVGK